MFKIGKDGEKTYDNKPIVSMGVRNAKSILDHFDELKEFVEENEE